MHRASIQRQVVSSTEDSIEPVELQRQQRIAFCGLGFRGLQQVEQLKSESLNPREGGSPPHAMILKTLSRQRLRPLIYLFRKPFSSPSKPDPFCDVEVQDMLLAVIRSDAH